MAVKIALAVGLFIVICGSPGLKSSQVIPDGLVYTEAKKILVRGAQGVLTCRFYGVPLAVYWRKGLDQSPMVIWQDGEVSGRRYDDGSCDVDENYSLIINNVSTANVGRMYCTVSNNKGPLMNNYTDILVVDTAITTNPQATLQMRQATFGILQCTVHIKARRVSWKKGTTSSANESLVVIENNQGFANRSGAGYDDGTYNITQEYSLVINELQIHHEGLYVCEVTDDTGISFRNHTFVNVVAQPLEPFPTVQECLNAKQHDPNYCILVAESGMTLTCQATKYYPSINLVFLYGSIVIKQSDTEEWENKDRTKNKTITIATRGNKELYTCVAFSIPGTNANTSTSVLLQGDVPVKSTMVIILVLCAALILISSVAYFIWRKKHHVSNPPDLPVRYSPIPGSAPHQELEGQVGDHIPSLTEEEIKRVAKEVKDYLAIHLCQIQADPLNSELVLEFKRIFTNLTLMEEDKGTKLKTPLPYDNLLRTKVNGNFPKRLLVEGEGGVGKTTFCAKIAWDWIHGKGYQDFKLVLVILLRKTEGKTVGEIVKSYLSDNNPVTAKQLDKHILSNPKDVFLVLDGLDELAVDLDSNQQIALITLNRLFKSGTVLITSRQWRSDEIRKNADLRKVFAFIAVEGFSAENLSSYITKYFDPDTASSEDLNRFISNNDVIRENMAPYPIYTAMLCIMWKEFDGERRVAMSKLQTFSKLFNQMIDFLVDHHLSKHIPSSGIVEGKLGDHCSDIRPHLIHIGCIAFQGLLKRRLVFTEEEFQSYPESIDVGCKVGVLTREKKILPRRDRRNTPNSVVQSVQFPHKLFQEYLSGMYLASLYNSNRDEYGSLIANIIPRAVEYRYLLYFTSAQQKGVGLDIVSCLMASNTERPYGLIHDDFIVDVAYESQDQEVAKAVADHLSTTSRKELNITTRMQAHTVSGHTFIMNHREVDDLIIEKPCGRTASEDLAEFMCSSRSPRSVTIDLTQVTGTMHDVFYSVLANKAGDSKIETLNIRSDELSGRPSASRDLAQFICKMTHVKALTLNGRYHNNFYSTSSSMASSAKIETLNIRSDELSGRPSASRDLAQFICKMTHLKKLELGGQFYDETPLYHDDFYSTASSMASSAKIETLNIRSGDLSGRPSASRDLAQFICKITHLKDLTLLGQYHDDFYSTSSSMASSAKIETLNIPSGDLSGHPSASRDLAQFICKITHLKDLTLFGQYHDDFYSTSSLMASSAKIETLDISSDNLSGRPSASRDLAQFICKMTHLKKLELGGQFYDETPYHDDFYSTVSSMASSAKIETLNIRSGDLSGRPSASRDLAQFICKMTHLKKLGLGGQFYDDFYSTSSSMASSAKIETLNIHSGNLSGRPSASRDLAQFICKITHLKDLTLFGQYHNDFYSTSSLMASSAKIETLNIHSDNLSGRPSASRDLAQFICKMAHLKDLTLFGQYHNDFYSTSSSMASSAKIETLNIRFGDLIGRSSASLDLAQFICKMTHLKKLTLFGQYHDDFYSRSSSMALSAKIETLNIYSDDLGERPSASRDLAQFICKMTHLKDLTLSGQYHDDLYSTSLSMASSAKIETLYIYSTGLSKRPSASRDLAQFICKMTHLKDLTLSGQYHNDFYSTSLSMASSAKSCNTSPTLTELTVGDDTLKGWQDCGSMFDSVNRVTMEVRSTINCDVIQRIHLPGATELTIQTHVDGWRPADFKEEPTSLPKALLIISPQLVKVTFRDLDIGNSKMELILQAFRSPHSLKHLRIIRFIRCGSDEGVDDVIIACNKDQVMEVEVEHGKPQV